MIKKNLLWNCALLKTTMITIFVRGPHTCVSVNMKNNIYKMVHSTERTVGLVHSIERTVGLDIYWVNALYLYGEDFVFV